MSASFLAKASAARLKEVKAKGAPGSLDTTTNGLAFYKKGSRNFKAHNIPWNTITIIKHKSWKAAPQLKLTLDGNETLLLEFAEQTDMEQLRDEISARLRKKQTAKESTAGPLEKVVKTVDLEAQASYLPKDSYISGLGNGDPNEDGNSNRHFSLYTDAEDKRKSLADPVIIKQPVPPNYAYPASTKNFKEEKMTTEDPLVEEDHEDAPVGGEGAATAAAEDHWQRGSKWKCCILLIAAVAAVIIVVVVSVVLTPSGTTTSPWNDILSDPTRTELDTYHLSPALSQSLFKDQSLPSELGLITALTRLVLFGAGREHHLISTLPTELGLLTRLTELSISYSALRGSIPTELGLLTELRQLNLKYNQMSGTIPTELGLLTDLNDLRLGNNQLSGTIPTELGLLTVLTSLYLQSNQLTGTIPLLPHVKYTFFLGNNLIW